MGAVFPAEVSSTAFPLELSITKEGVGGVAGLAPTVSVRDSASLTRYLDWADMTFKTSSWIRKSKVLSDVGNGMYQTAMDLTAITPAVASGQAFVSEYTVNAPGIIGFDADVLLRMSIEFDISLLRRLALNRLEEYAGNPGTLILFADDGVTPLKTWSLRDASGGPIVSVIGAPARRSAAT